MGNKNECDSCGTARELLASADSLLEQAYYASDDSRLSRGIARARRTLAELYAS